MDRHKESDLLQNMDTALAEIERTLDQMLTLARLSAADLNVDRAALQKTLERLQNKVGRIADMIDTACGR